MNYNELKQFCDQCETISIYNFGQLERLKRKYPYYFVTNRALLNFINGLFVHGLTYEDLI